MKRLLILAFVLLVGCEKPQIASYSVPHEEKKPLSPIESPSPSKESTSNYRVSWHAPHDWIAQKASGFRKGSYSVEGKDGSKADISIISFPGDAGGLLANVNRWRNQITLPPLSAVELEKSLQKIKITGYDIDFVEMANTTENGKTRVLGGILQLPGEVWFFKISGNDALTSSQKKSFRDLLSSVKVEPSK